MTSGGGETGFNAGPDTFTTKVKAGVSVLRFSFTLYGYQAYNFVLGGDRIGCRERMSNDGGEPAVRWYKGGWGVRMG